MSDLVKWLRERLDTAETDTRTLLHWAQQTILTLQDPKLLGKHIPGWHDWPNVEKMCHQRLAEMDANRRILDLHDGLKRRVRSGGYATDEYALAALEVVVARMAVPHAAHPGYRPEWRPA